MNHVILGDDAFPLKNFLLKPFPKQTQSNEEIIFNYRQSKGRFVVANVFGILTSRFRILLDRINLIAERVDLIVWVCCGLHNMLMEDTPQITPSTDSNKLPTSTLTSMNTLRANKNSETERNNRQEFARYFSNEGSVPWKWNKIPNL